LKLPVRLRLALQIIGAGSFLAALWISVYTPAHDRRIDGRNVTIWFVVFLVCLALAAPKLPKSKDPRLFKSQVRPEDLVGTVYGLEPGRVYRVVRTFSDCYSNNFEQGRTLTFRQRNFVPYHGGHTVMFDEATIYLQETESAEILGNFSQYIAPA
jgi:hypothetical protein